MTDAKSEIWKRVGENAERKIEEFLTDLADDEVAGAAAEEVFDTT